MVARALALLLLTGAVLGQESTPSRPNIVLIVADDLGYGDLGCYGQQRLATPHLDRLAAEGRRYTQFYAGSTVCAPSRCVLMTGQHTGRCQVRGNGGPPLRDQDVTVAELLADAGYACGGFGKWGLGREGSSGVPTRQGFATWFGYLDQRHAHNYWPTFLVEDEGRVDLRNEVPDEDARGAGEASERVDYSHDLIVERALQFVDEHREHPFFLYLPVTIPHANNEARTRHGMEVPDLGAYADRDWPAAARGFAAMVARLDRDVGRLLAKLAEHGLEDDTLVLFTSDNGPHREGRHDPEFFASRGGLRGIKRSLHDGGLRVPLLARWPGQVPAGTTSDHVAGFQDLLPTFAELAGVTELPDHDGISMLRSLRGDDEQQARHDHLYWAFFEGGRGQALRIGRWKVVQQPYGSAPRLYDLEADPAEATDVAADHPQVVAEVRARMTAAFRPHPRWRLQKQRPHAPRAPVVVREAPYIEDEPGGRTLALVRAELFHDGAAPRLRLRVAATGPGVDPVPGFEGIAGANRITARELGRLLAGDALAVVTTTETGAELRGDARPGRRGRVPVRRVDASGRIQLDAWTYESFPLELWADSGPLPPGRARFELRVEGVPRLRVTLQVSATGGHIEGIESFGGPPIDA